ncbi:MAG: hypothetical protein LBE31_10815, partial [Deltaproteobacteria bacterium]|nr:hypothetical protein [Deltaproteobacteria bacterium]
GPNMTYVMSYFNHQATIKATCQNTKQDNQQATYQNTNQDNQIATQKANLQATQRENEAT